MTIHTVGEPAYIDSFSGLIPCKVTEITRSHDPHTTIRDTMVTVTVTANRGSYHEGDTTTRIGSMIIPRSKVFLRTGQYHVHTDYVWKEGSYE